jgi:YHS domain-containing protein
MLGFVLLTTGLAFAQQTPSVAQAKVQVVDVGNKICPVSGAPVAGGSGMGDQPVTVEYNGKVYHLCCPMCIEEFKKNPEKYSKIAEDEVKAVKK